MRDERPAVPGQEELPVWRVPAAAPAPEEPSLLQGNLVASGFASYCTVAEEGWAAISNDLLFKDQHCLQILPVRMHCTLLTDSFG